MDRDNYHSRIPEPALRRLPWYLSYIKLLKKQGYTNRERPFVCQCQRKNTGRV